MVFQLKYEIQYQQLKEVSLRQFSPGEAYWKIKSAIVSCAQKTSVQDNFPPFCYLAQLAIITTDNLKPVAIVWSGEIHPPTY